jgi:cell division protein FtsW (lipid II flippase)
MAKKLAFDKVLFTIVVLLMFFGQVMVFSASSALTRDGGVNRFLLKQGVSAALGLALMAWDRARACRSSSSCPTRSRTSSSRSWPRSSA